MRVPVRRLPQTRVSEQQQGYARPVEPLNTEPLSRLAEGFREQLLDEQDARQRVELNRRLLTEVNELQLDFAARRTNPDISPIDFAAGTEAAYAERHRALLGELEQEGYSRDLLDEFDGRLGSARQGLFTRGLEHQITQLDSRAGEQIEDVGRQASQYAAVNPLTNYVTARDMLLESIRGQPDLTEDRRAALEDQELPLLRDAAARALAIQNPQLVIDALDPQGHTAPYRPPAAGGTPSATATPTTGWQGVATNVANELGLDPVEVAAVMSYESAGSFDPARMGGAGNNYMGLIQFGPEERRTYGITANSTPEQWTTAILSFMRDRGFRRGMPLIDFYSTILAGRPGRPNASDGHGTVTTHLERLLREHRSNAERWLGVARPTQTASVQPTDLPPSSAVQQSDARETPAEPAGPGDLSAIRTGNPLIDDLDGRQRLVLLGLAREQLNRTTATQRAEMDVRINNFVAERMNGDSGTPLPNEQEVLQLYGPVEGPQRMAQMRAAEEARPAIVNFRTQSAETIQQTLDSLEPTPGSPTYATELPVYEAAQRAAQALLQERERDPAAYALRHFPSVGAAAQRGTAQYYAELDRVYQTLGINPEDAPVMSAQATERLTQRYQEMTPSQRREFMRQNMGEMGEDRFRRFVRGVEGTTMEGDARIFRFLRNVPGQPGQASNLFHRILEGRQIIAEDPARKPPAAALLTEFRRHSQQAIGDLHPEASRAIQEAVEGLYAQQNGNPTTIDQPLYRRLLTEVLGGNLPVAMGHGAASAYRTILPPRVSQQQFQSWIERQTLQSISAASTDGRPPRYGDLRTAVPIEHIIEHGAFVMVAPGQYMIRMAGNGQPLATSTGRPFVVNINTRDVLTPPRLRIAPVRGRVQ